MYPHFSHPFNVFTLLIFDFGSGYLLQDFVEWLLILFSVVEHSVQKGDRFRFGYFVFALYLVSFSFLLFRTFVLPGFCIYFPVLIFGVYFSHFCADFPPYVCGGSF